MKNIVESPYSDGKAELKYEITEETFRKEKFNVRKYFYKCRKTGKEFTTTEVGDINITQIFNLYRERKKVLFPEQIKEMRERYGLSAAKMSEVLGFGANTYSNYEKGEIPNESNSTLLNQAYKTKEFLSIIKEKEDLFSEKQYAKLLKRVEELTANDEERRLKEFLFPGIQRPTEYTGYRLPDIEKIANMVLYFLKDPYTYITRLNKYLFYTDFLNFRNTGYSISGLDYYAIQYGPVPSSYEMIYSILLRDEYIGYKNKFGKDGNEESKYTPLKKFNKDIFSRQETEMLENVYEKLRFEKTQKIIEMSHEEEAWKKNQKQKGRISYMKYGFDIKGV